MSDQPEHNQEQKHVAVIMSDPDFRMPPEAIPYWDLTRALIKHTRFTLGNELAFSILLSQIMRELRRAYGVEAAIKTLQGFMDTMDKAAQYDI
jgi:hypothetical protein